MRFSPRFLVSLLMLGMAAQAFWVARQITLLGRERISPWTIRIDLEADRNGLAKVYWDGGQGIREVDSTTAPVIGGAAVRTVRFSVPRIPFRSVRFDPLRSEGSVRIHRIELRSGSGRLLSRTDPSEVRAGNQVASFSNENGVVVARFAEGARDPYLLLGAMESVEEGARRGFPWLGLIFLAAILAGLFRLREHTGAWVAGIRRIGTLPPAWSEFVVRIDRPGWTTLAIGAVLVTSIQAILLFPLHRVMDLPLWDEARTMSLGAAFLSGSGLGRPPDSPLAILSYAGWVEAFGRIGAIFAAHYVIKAALASVVFLFTARTASSILAGIALSAVWMVSDFLLSYPILTYQLALFWYILGLLTIQRQPLIGAGCALLAALTRLEYQFAFIVFLALITAGLRPRGFVRAARWSWPAWAGAGLVWGLAGYVIVHLDGWNGGTERGWFAVEQHYALRLSQEGEFPGHNPFLDYPLVTERDFPGARSLGEAVKVNPGALAAHVWWNLQRIPGSWLGLFRSYERVGSGIGGALLIGLLLMGPGLLALMRSRFADAHHIRILLGEKRATVFAVFAGILVIAPGVIVFPKEPYLLPVLPLGWALCGCIHRLGNLQGMRRSNRRAALLAAIIGLSGIALNPKPFVEGTGRRPVYETAEVLKAALPTNGPIRLLGVTAGSYADLLGPERIRGIEPIPTFRGEAFDKDEVQVEHLLELHHPDLILIEESWRRSPYFDSEGAADLKVQGWTETPVPGGILLQRP